MLLKGYRKEISRPECNPGFQSVGCIAYLDEDVTAVLPYLNAELGGFEYLKEPPAVTFRLQGKIIAVHGDKITVNTLKDEEDADKILQWLQREINDVWERRNNITPSYEGAPKPNMLEILKRLPGLTGCRKCGQPTCMVFATLVAKGAKGSEGCPELTLEKTDELRRYMSRFALDT